MKNQEPMKGVSLLTDFRDGTKAYRINCDCHECTHDVTVWIEVDRLFKDCRDISVTFYADSRSSWLSKDRWKNLWRLLTKGYVETHNELILSEEVARNMTQVILSTIEDCRAADK